MLPNNLAFNNNVEPAQARSYKSNIQPQTGSTFKKGETIIFNIPTRQNLIMAPSETYLRGNVAFKNGADANNYLRWDSCGVNGLIYRVNVYHGSNLIETIENYNVLAKMMYDLQVSTPQANGKLSILAGTGTEYVGSVNAIAVAGVGAGVAVPAIAIPAYNTPVKYMNYGRRLNAYGTAIAGGASINVDFAIPLISIIGSLSPKYFPLFACKSAPLRVEITLVSDPLQAILSDSNLDLTDGLIVSNVELVCQMMELSDSAINTIQSSTNGKPLQYAFGDYRNFRQSAYLANGTSTTTSIAIPAKYASLKSLFFAQRATDKFGILDYFPLPSEKLRLTQYQIRVGPELLPPKAPSTTPEIFAELLKAVGSISDLSHSPAIDFDTYNINDAVTQATVETLAQPSNVSSPSFYVGLDLENYSGSDKSQLFAGRYTANDDIFFNATYGNPGANLNILIDCFALFDSVIVFENDTCYVKN